MPFGIGFGELLVLLVLACPFFIIAFVFFLLTLHKALSRCAPESRTMDTGQVWLMFIPLFNLVWQFIVISRVSSSLGNEFRRRNIPAEAQPAKAVGLASCILFVTSFIPILGLFTGIGAFVCWIIYWVKIAGYSAQLVGSMNVAPARI
jgi:hypothetical protein